MFHTYVASVSCGCCKIDLYVAYVAMAIHTCFKRMFQVFHLDISKVDPGITCCNGTGGWQTAACLQPPAIAGALPWVTMRALEAGRWPPRRASVGRIGD
jgi:hypothetical protein